MNNNYPSPLINQVCSANKVVNDLFIAAEEKNKLRNLAANETYMEMNCKKKRSLVGIYVFCLLGVPIISFFPLLLGALIIASELADRGVIPDTESTLIIVCLLVGIIVVVLSIGLLIILSKNRAKNIKKHHDSAIEYQKQAREKERYSNKLLQLHSKELEIIPAQYRYPLATSYIAELFINGRATTIPEALDKFEEQLHRWNMERSMQHNIEIQLAQTKILHDIWRWI